MESAGGEQPLSVRFVRAGARAGSGVRLQEWRSDLTGRVFEVDERDAYAPAEGLEPGDRGYLAFVGGTVVVTRRRGDPPPRPGSRTDGADGVGAAPPRARGRNGWLWLVVAVAVAVLLLRLLR